MNIHRLSDLATVVCELNDSRRYDGKYKYALYRPKCAVLLPNKNICVQHLRKLRTELTNSHAFQHIDYFGSPLHYMLCWNDYNDTICSYKTCIEVKFYSTYGVISGGYYLGRVGNIFVDDEIYDDVVEFAKKKHGWILQQNWTTVEVGWFTREVYKHCRSKQTKKIDSNELDEFFKLFPTT